MELGTGGQESRGGIGRELLSAAIGWGVSGACAGVLIGSAAIRMNSSLEGPGQAAPFLGLLIAAYALSFAVSGIAVELASRMWKRSPAGIRANLALELATRRWSRPPAGIQTHLLVSTLGFFGFMGASLALGAIPWLRDQLVLSLGIYLVLGLFIAITCRQWPGPFPWKLLPVAAVITILAIAGFGFLAVGTSSAPELATAKSAGPPLELARSTSGELPRVMLIGVDGAEWARLKPLMAAGRLPNFARLCTDAYTAPLQTTMPTLSPVIWTTIVTGVREDVHGVLDFTSVWLPGMERGIQCTYAKYGGDPKLPTHVGLVEVIKTLVNHRWIDETPIDALQRRQKALWNILSEHGVKSAFVRWWATWPAEKFDGWMLSDNDPLTQVFAAEQAGLTHVAASQDNVTWPAQLTEDLLPLIKQDGELVSAKKGQIASLLDDPIFADLKETETDELRANPLKLKTFELIVRGDRFATRTAVKLWNEQKPPMLGVYLRAVDNISHRFGQRTGVVDHTYEFMDARLGELLAAGGPDTTYVLVSDHGWCYEPGPNFGHHDAPPGVVIIQGPNIQPTNADLSPSVLDITPTILAMFGLPPSTEMTGKPLLEVFVPGSAAAVVRERIADYGAYRPVWPPISHGSDAGKQQSVDLLRALGYL
ncbi:MAG TPA: alkaline phosphatase family protein [Planctomycetota bacterium]|nr:alkaline phosphatase family protein [Planctomycetota bacterium]